MDVLAQLNERFPQGYRLEPVEEPISPDRARLMSMYRDFMESANELELRHGPYTGDRYRHAADKAMRLISLSTPLPKFRVYPLT